VQEILPGFERVHKLSCRIFNGTLEAIPFEAVMEGAIQLLWDEKGIKFTPEGWAIYENPEHAYSPPRSSCGGTNRVR